LDIKYFESCLDLNLCSEFLKFKIPNLTVHSNRKDVFQTVVRKKLKEVNREKQVAKVRFNSLKNGVLAKLSFLEKTSLISLLNQEFKKAARPHILTLKKKCLIYGEKNRINARIAFLI